MGEAIPITLFLMAMGFASLFQNCLGVSAPRDRKGVSAARCGSSLNIESEIRP
jgi:hypothetical protein